MPLFCCCFFFFVVVAAWATSNSPMNCVVFGDDFLPGTSHCGTVPRRPGKRNGSGLLAGWAPRTDISGLGSPPYHPPILISHKVRPVWKGSHNPILRGRNRSPWLTTYPSHGMILQVDPTYPASFTPVSFPLASHSLKLLHAVMATPRVHGAKSHRRNAHRMTYFGCPILDALHPPLFFLDKIIQ